MMLIAKHKNGSTDAERLMDALRFDGEDLEVNRAGTLSSRQIRQLHREFWDLIAGYSVFVVIVGGMLLGIYQKIPLDQRAANPATYLMAMMACGTGVGFIYVVYQHYKNVSNGQVVAFTGRVKKYGPILIVINYAAETERIYKVDGATYIALVEGETYRIHSLSYEESKLLSAEHIPTP